VLTGLLGLLSRLLTAALLLLTGLVTLPFLPALLRLAGPAALLLLTRLRVLLLVRVLVLL
jgi:hypothetical protein